jgi:hypothetical protein
MTDIATMVSRFNPSEGRFDTLKSVAVFCGIGLLVSLMCLTYGLDLSPGFF